MRNTALLDILFQIYIYACPLLPFAIVCFLFSYQKRLQKKNGADDVSKTPSRRAEILHGIGLALFGVYLAMVLDVTASGTLYDLLRSGGLAINTATVNLIPFSDPDYSPVGYTLNVIMLMPFGFLLPTLFRDKRKLWLLNYRSTDVDDVILNTLGAGIGYFIYRLFARVTRYDIGQADGIPCESAVLVLAAFLGKFLLYNGYGLACLLYPLYPG